MHDYAVYIGRFQPFHIGHLSVLKHALQNARRVIVLVGSANLHRSPKNPFTFEERKQFIHYNLVECDAVGRVDVLPLNDVPYNDTAWQTQVRTLVESVAGNRGASIALVGFDKDPSTYYLGMFPEWEKINVLHKYGTFNATGIREQFFQDTPVTSEFLAFEVRKALRQFVFTPEFKWILDEAKFLKGYHEVWGQGPFVTVDSVATQSGHILLVRRRAAPYAGSLALPGGFLSRPSDKNGSERLIDACVRELKEETRISDQHGEIPHGKLKSYITGPAEVFDAPDRDPRGRLITHAYRYVFPNAKERFHVRGDDDAESAQWYSLHDLNPRDFMGDHWFIIQKMTGIQWK
jgi:bifunctional NMN adenylyltransferase/nudix hydrolase